MAATVLVAAVALLLVRLSLDGRSSGGRAASRSLAPTTTATVPPDQRPPYDRRPGRTPIPAPTQIGDQLAGTLPELGGPDQRSARRSADLVLERYCVQPSRFTFSLSSDDGYRRVRVFVVDLARSGGPVQQWSLVWTGRSYQWTGPVLLTEGC